MMFFLKCFRKLKGIAFSLLFLSGIGASAQYSDESVEIGEVNFEILEQIAAVYLMRDGEFFSSLHYYVPEYSAEKYLKKHQAEVEKIEGLYFLQRSLSRWDIFAVSLYAKEITHKVQALEASLTYVERYLAVARVVYASRKELIRKLESLDLNRLSPFQRIQRQEKLSLLREHVKHFEAFADLLSRCNNGAQMMRERCEKFAQQSENYRFQMLKNEFFCMDSDLFYELFHEQIGKKSSEYYSKQYIQKHFPSFSRYWPKFFNMLLVAGIPFFVLGSWLFRQVIKRTKLGDIDSRSRIFYFGFALLSCAFVVGMTKDAQTAVESMMLGRVAEWLFGCAVLIMALSIRLKRIERRAALQIYIPAALQNILAVLLTSVLMPYRGLVSIVPFVSFVVFVWVALAMWRVYGRLQPLDRILGWLILIVTLLSGVTAGVGLAYLGFTLMLSCFAVISNLLILFAVIELLMAFTRNNPKREFLNIGITKLLLPSFTLYMLWQMFQKTAELFNMNDTLLELMSVPLIESPEIMTITLNGLLFSISGAFILNYCLNFKRIWVIRVYGEAAEVGFIPSLMTLTSYFFWTVYVLFVLVLFNVNYQAILVVLGALSMGLGFGLKDIVENFISGILLLVGQQLRPGDVVEYGSEMGVVKRVRIRDTLVETFEGAVLTIPNSQVLSINFRNWTSNNMIRRSDVVVGVAYGTDLEQAKKLIKEAIECTPFILSNPPPEIYTDGFGGSSMDFKILFWTPIAQRRNVASRLRETIYTLFNQNNITIPFPQLDVHFDPLAPCVNGNPNDT